MLKREDIDELFEILAAYRKNDPKLCDKSIKAAWLLSLKPYGKGDVKEAIGVWFRKSKCWPEPAEIAVLCPPLPEENRLEKTPQFLRRELDETRKLWARWDGLAALRREAGIPASLSEAEAAGLSDREWFDLLEEKGLTWT